jgi:hypothetical protein
MKPYSPEYGLVLGRKIQGCTRGRLDYTPSGHAPSTLTGLKAAFKIHQASAAPLLVFKGGCETSIYGSPEANYAFRYLHDSIHAICELGFDLAAECNVADLQERRLGYLSPEESLTFRIDTIGQALYSFLSGGAFLQDQARFVGWVYEEVRRLRDNTPPEPDHNLMQHLQQAVLNYYQGHQ